MKKQLIRILIPLLLIGGYEVYTWFIIFTTDTIATWRHYLTLLLYISVLIILITHLKKGIIATGIFLVAGICSLVVLTPGIARDSFSLNIGSLHLRTPSINLLSAGIFVIYALLNMDALINIYLDYKESGEKKD